MSFERLAEARIREAMEAGAFRNLKGAGRPIGHSEYFAAPDELRAGHAVLKNNGFVPDEVSLLREVGELREALDACATDVDRVAAGRRLQAAKLRLNLLLERRRTRRR